MSNKIDRDIKVGDLVLYNRTTVVTVRAILSGFDGVSSFEPLYVLDRGYGTATRDQIELGPFDSSFIQFTANFCPEPVQDPDTGLIYGGGKATHACPYCDEEIIVDFEDGIEERCEHLVSIADGSLLFNRDI